MATTQEVTSSVADAVAEVTEEIEPADVTAEKEFVSDLGVDSLAMVEVVVMLEEAHDVRIPDDAVRGFRTVGDLVAHLEAATS